MDFSNRHFAWGVAGLCDLPHRWLGGIAPGWGLPLHPAIYDVRFRGPIQTRPSLPENPLDRAARLEAVLLVAKEPLPSRKLAQLAELEDGTEARTLARQLNERLDARGAAFRVEQVAGGFQMLTRPAYSPWLRRLHQNEVLVQLSAPALETLSIVAYRQPILRAQVEAIRGVQCGEMLKQLMERELVRIAGKSPELGRPFLYGTTKRFLQVFGLRDLEDLPRYEELKSAVSETGSGLDSSLEEKESQVKSSLENVTIEDETLEDPRAVEDDLEDDEDDDFEDELDEDLDDDEEEDEDWEEDEDLEEGDDYWEEVEDEDLDDDEEWEDEDEDWEDEDDWEDDDEEEDWEDDEDD